MTAKPKSQEYDRAFAAALIKEHEGVRSHPYIDSVGKVTIGVGRNLTDRGLTVEEVNHLFETDMRLAADILDIWLVDWTALSMHQQAALLSMAYNLGGPRLSQFVKMRSALLAGDFAKAAAEALNSQWAGQVGRRADEIASLLQKP